MIKHNLHVYGEGEVAVPAHLNFGQLILDKIKNYKDDVAIIAADTGAKLTYAELAQKVVDIALSLARLGVRKGQVVGILSGDQLEYIPTLLGIACAGATSSVIDISGTAIITHRMQMVKPRVMFCSVKAYQEYRDALQSVGSVEHYVVYGKERCAGATLFDEFLCAHAPVDRFLAAPVDGTRDYYCIDYSSGTTGLPKCVPKTHMQAMAFSNKLISSFRGKRVFNAHHYSFSLVSLRFGATVIFVQRNENYEVVEFLEATQKYKVQEALRPPSTLFALVNSPLLSQYDLSSLQSFISFGAPLRLELIEAVHEKFPGVQLLQIYGSTEAGLICTNDVHMSKPGSIGILNSDVIMKVEDLITGEPLGPHQRGEICVKSYGCFSGYLGFTTLACFDEEGFFKTGDVGYYDEDKYIYLVDRRTDMILCNNIMVAPMELEAILEQHPAVLQAAVVGVPDEQNCELPAAFVVLQPGVDVTAQELIDYVDSQVTDRMRLRGGVRFIESLPRVSNGKLDRKALKLLL